MKKHGEMLGLGLAAALLIAASAPASTAPADAVKAGVDAWGRGDYQGAVEQWRPLAIAGDPDAQFNLGQAYKLGRGVPVDIGIAAEWYRKAAAHGHVQAADNYGLALFQSGRHAEAVAPLERSAARGEPRAQLVLGTMLFNGDSVARDWARAYALLARSAAAGLPEGSQKLAEMDRYIPLDVRQRGIALARQYAAADAAAALPATSATPPPPPATAIPVASKPVTSPPAAKRGTTGAGWRVQFGAFRNEGNASQLWQALRSRVSALAGSQPIYARSGTLTKLQTGGFASSAATADICKAVTAAVPGTPCVPVAP